MLVGCASRQARQNVLKAATFEPIVYRAAYYHRPLLQLVHAGDSDQDQEAL